MRLEKEIKEQEYKRQLRESMKEDEHFYARRSRSSAEDKFLQPQTVKQMLSQMSEPEGNVTIAWYFINLLAFILLMIVYYGLMLILFLMACINFYDY